MFPSGSGWLSCSEPQVSETWSYEGTLAIHCTNILPVQEDQERVNESTENHYHHQKKEQKITQTLDCKPWRQCLCHYSSFATLVWLLGTQEESKKYSLNVWIQKTQVWFLKKVNTE